MEKTSIISLSLNNIKSQTNKVSENKIKENFEEVLGKEIEKNEVVENTSSSKNYALTSDESKKAVQDKNIDIDSTRKNKIMKNNDNAENNEKFLLCQAILNLLDQILDDLDDIEITDINNEEKTIAIENIQLIIKTLNDLDIKLNYETLELLNNIKSILNVTNPSNNLNINSPIINDKLVDMLKNLKENLLNLNSNIKNPVNLNPDTLKTNFNTSYDRGKIPSKNILEKFVVINNNKNTNKVEENSLYQKIFLSDKESQSKENSSFILLTSKNDLNKIFNNNQDNMITDFNNLQVEKTLTNNINLEANKILSNTSNKIQNNIFNQIIESAKINLSEEVSEMTIKLKPDNLGKVSLKLILERGLVIAKFDVENQIVKEALEANLEDLKSALAEKGYQIKEFNVSVNKDSKNHQKFYSHSRKKQMSISNSLLKEFSDNDYIQNHYSLINTSKVINILA